ncbi:NAD-dependent epimerase/dehydratase [Cocos nucifera]|uniref:UDP-glucuronate decarboxylase n=1 Tax=Cocos nucifera TaxID=13894 RepID=A0A8K0IYB0_COCNU|nr:NAD-dependent epimerase/dehydratase [Cocos nucifera]
MGSELIYRGHEAQPQDGAGGYSPKPPKRCRWLSRPLRYLLGEQRLLCVLVGMALASLAFVFLPRAPPAAGSAVGAHVMVDLVRRSAAGVDGGYYNQREALPARRFVGGKTNVVGTLNMLGLAKRVGARFLLTSTSEVYGDPLQHPQVETYWGNVNPIGVRSCYDEGKRTAETLTMDYHRGAHVEALRKEPMTVYGDGKQTRSFQYVSDLVEGLMRLMEGEHVGPFNLGNPGEFTMLELANVVQETIDLNARIEFRPNTEDDPHKRKPDITKAKELLGWEPKISLRHGLPLMVSDFRKRIFGDQSTSDAGNTGTGTGTS